MLGSGPALGDTGVLDLRSDMVQDLLRFTDRLRGRGYPGLDLEVAVFPDEFEQPFPGPS